MANISHIFVEIVEYYFITNTFRQNIGDHETLTFSCYFCLILDLQSRIYYVSQFQCFVEKQS